MLSIGVPVPVPVQVYPGGHIPFMDITIVYIGEKSNSAVLYGNPGKTAFSTGGCGVSRRDALSIQRQRQIRNHRGLANFKKARLVIQKSR